jgi:uncharacterized protein YbjT (DUF2867 family)
MHLHLHSPDALSLRKSIIEGEACQAFALPFVPAIRHEHVMTILLAGASGLIGNKVAEHLAGPSLAALIRKPVELPTGIKSLTGPTETWPSLIADAKPSIAISTLGTTMRQAGSEAAFRAVDLDLVLAVARAAREAGASHFIAVSSVGASSKSRSFYLRIKGEAEDGLRALGFERLDFVRPGLLRGDRGGERRPGERLAILASPITDFLTPSVLDMYRSIAADTVAKAIAALCNEMDVGTHVHHNREITDLAAR